MDAAGARVVLSGRTMSDMERVAAGLGDDPVILPAGLDPQQSGTDPGEAGAAAGGGCGGWGGAAVVDRRAGGWQGGEQGGGASGTRTQGLGRGERLVVIILVYIRCPCFPYPISRKPLRGRD